MNNNKITFTKKIHKLLLMIIFVIFCCLSGCYETDEGTIVPDAHSRKLTISGSTSLTAGQNSVITVKITDGEDNNVREQKVTFIILSNNSGGTLTVLNGITDADGQALALYTAGGDDPGEDVEDIIQASVEGATDVLNIKRTADTTPVADYISDISSSPSTMAGGRMSIITAKVTAGKESEDGSNQTITFTIPANNSGACFIDSTGANVSSITTTMQMSQGNILPISVIYKAGINDSGTVVQDIVQAILGNGSTDYVVITRT
jgi:hypothetical protein